MLLQQLHGTSRSGNEPAIGWAVKDLDQEEMIPKTDGSGGIRSGRIADPATRDPSELLHGVRGYSKTITFCAPLSFSLLTEIDCLRTSPVPVPHCKI